MSENPKDLNKDRLYNQLLLSCRKICFDYADSCTYCKNLIESDPNYFKKARIDSAFYYAQRTFGENVAKEIIWEKGKLFI